MKLKQGKSRKFFIIHAMIVLSIVIAALILNSTYSYATGDLGIDERQLDAAVTTPLLLQQSSVNEHLEFEQKVADIEFVLHQFELIDMPSFNFTIEISDNSALRQLMLLTISELLEKFRRDNPDVIVQTYKQQNDKLLLTVKLITPENRAGFSQKAILI